MTSLRAFVGHSFNESDETVVQTILKFLDDVKELQPGFVWEHAMHAQPKELAEKVLQLIEGKNVFIGICTKKEQVVQPNLLKRTLFGLNGLKAPIDSFKWKTSDWVIQEIGLARGRDLHIVLLIEEGLEKPGGLQGDLEYISFNRNSPEKCFGKLVQMLSAISETVGINHAEPESKAISIQNPDPLPPPDGDEWATPRADWTRREFEVAFMYSAMLNDQSKMDSISTLYVSTEDGLTKENIETWPAFKELALIRFGKGGKLDTLVSLLEKSPDNGELIFYLGQAYSEYEEYRKAAETYRKAASLVNNEFRKLQLFGAAVPMYQKAGDLEKAVSTINEMKSFWSHGPDGEAEILRAQVELAKLTNNLELELATLERLVELNPSDIKTRSDLAYKYLNNENYDLSILHYIRIPYAERSSMIWNNLGVAYSYFGLPAKAVQAYRESESKGETLAMSNLSNKFLEVGFVPEAQKICSVAVAIPDHHKNVDSTLARLKDISEEEEKAETNALSKVKPISEFYRGFGHALTSDNQLELALNWQGPNCTLDISVSKDSFSAKGSFEKTSTGLAGLASLSSGLASSQSGSAPTRYLITYRGKITGKAVVGTITQKRDGGLTTASTLLGSGEESATVLMTINELGDEICVLEKSKIGEPKFYILKSINKGRS